MDIPKSRWHRRAASRVASAVALFFLLADNEGERRNENGLANLDEHVRDALLLQVLVDSLVILCPQAGNDAKDFVLLHQLVGDLAGSRASVLIAADDEFKPTTCCRASKTRFASMRS